MGPHFSHLKLNMGRVAFMLCLAPQRAPNLLTSKAAPPVPLRRRGLIVASGYAVDAAIAHSNETSAQVMGAPISID